MSKDIMLQFPRFEFGDDTIKNPSVSIFNKDKEFKVGDNVSVSYVTNRPTADDKSSDEKEVIIEGELVEIWVRFPRSDDLLMHLNGGVDIKTNEGKIENIPSEFIYDIINKDD